MLKITFGKTRYNADKLILNEENNTLELGNGYIMTNLSENTNLADFVAYINKQYNLGDNIINAGIWYSRNGGSETEANYKVEKISKDCENEQELEMQRLLRIIFIDGDQTIHYGVKILDIEPNALLFMTPRSIVMINVPAGNITITIEELTTAFSNNTVVTLESLFSIIYKNDLPTNQTITSKTFNRLMNV